MNPRLSAAIAALIAARSVQAQPGPDLPERPWTQVRHVELPATITSPLLARPGGGAAVILGPPGAVALLNTEGALIGSWGTDASQGAHGWWSSSETVQLTRGQDTVLTYSIDGGLRGWTRFADPLHGGLSLDAPQGAVLSFRGPSALIGAQIDWSGAVVQGFSARAGWRPATTPPCADGRGGVWIGAGAGIVRVHPSERRVALSSGVRSLHSRVDGGLIAVVEGAVWLLDGESERAARIAIDATVIDLAARRDGGVALLLQSSRPAVALFDSAGAPIARFEVPADARSLTLDARDAALVASRGGELATWDAQGHPGWRLTLPARLRLPPIALSATCYAVATEAREVVTLCPEPAIASVTSGHAN